MGKQYLIRSKINSDAKNIECKVKNWRHVPSAVDILRDSAKGLVTAS